MISEMCFVGNSLTDTNYSQIDLGNTKTCL
uniref:Uncharacterized protein n=1 Tax=Anguilla anguilla TaxID=7936 RepID=A0A0E9WDZ6_ANGAN